MENLKPYMKYKSADLLWIDSIPEHWEICKNKNVMTLKKDIVGNKSSEYTLLSLTKRGIIPRDLENAKGKFPKEFNTYQVINENDIVFCLFDIDETPRTVGISLVEGMITGAYTVFRAKNINEKYLHYYYFSLDNHKKLKPLYTGLRKVINTDAFLRIKMPIPPIDEQDQIVNYLDFKLSKIAKLIHTKKKLIASLKEQKQEVINKAVTKGLESDVKMKPSGVEWLSDVPEEWEVVRLKFLTDMPFQYGANETGIEFSHNLPRYIRITDINDDGKLKNTGKLSLPMEKSDRFILKDGDILFARSGATAGKTFHYTEDRGTSCFAGYLIRFSPNKRKLLPEFAYYYTLSSTYFAWLNRVLIQSTIQNISAEKYKNLFIPLPDIKEQYEIIKKLKEEVELFDKTISKINREIDLISQYHDRLILDVVTGKIDVRSVEIPKAKEINAIKNDSNLPLNDSNEEDKLKENRTTMFLSYSKYDSSLADLIEPYLEKLIGIDINISRYIRDVGYRESFKAFMDTIGLHDYVIMIISENYLKSKNCMYEALEVFKSPNYQHKLLFIIVDEKDKILYKPIPRVKVEADIYDIEGRVKYIKYWENCIETTEKIIKEINDIALTYDELKELQLMKKIRAELPEIFAYFKDSKGISVTDLINSGFIEFINIINKKL